MKRAKEYGEHMQKETKKKMAHGEEKTRRNKTGRNNL
jgi:hypothetical protein